MNCLCVWVHLSVYIHVCVWVCSFILLINSLFSCIYDPTCSTTCDTTNNPRTLDYVQNPYVEQTVLAIMAYAEAIKKTCPIGFAACNTIKSMSPLVFHETLRNVSLYIVVCFSSQWNLHIYNSNKNPLYWQIGLLYPSFFHPSTRLPERFAWERGKKWLPEETHIQQSNLLKIHITDAVGLCVSVCVCVTVNKRQVVAMSEWPKWYRGHLFKNLPSRVHKTVLLFTACMT